MAHTHVNPMCIPHRHTFATQSHTDLSSLLAHPTTPLAQGLHLPAPTF